MQSTVFEHGGNSVAVTVSIGVSTWEPLPGENPEELVHRADTALYRAKEQGRNRVCA